MTLPTQWKARGMLFVMAADADANGVVQSSRLSCMTDLAAGAEAGCLIRRDSEGRSLFRFVTRKLRETYERPVYLGDHLTLETQTIAIGSKSVTVRVRVMVERDKDGSIEQVGEATAWMVAVNDGRAVAHGAAEDGTPYFTDPLAFTTQHEDFWYPQQPLPTEHQFGPQDLNHMGAVFGGAISSRVADEAHALVRRLLSVTHKAVMPTVSFVITGQEVDFVAPILPGERARFDSQVVAVGTHAAIVGIQIYVAGHKEHVWRNAGEASVVLVSVNAQREKAPHNIGAG